MKDEGINGRRPITLSYRETQWNKSLPISSQGDWSVLGERREKKKTSRNKKKRGQIRRNQNHRGPKKRVLEVAYEERGDKNQLLRARRLNATV